ncbi:MAG: hypothetical protein ACLSDO_01035 [Anaerotruncus colihominis]
MERSKSACISISSAAPRQYDRGGDLQKYGGSVEAAQQIVG